MLKGEDRGQRVAGWPRPLVMAALLLGTAACGGAGPAPETAPTTGATSLDEVDETGTGQPGTVEPGSGEPEDRPSSVVEGTDGLSVLPVRAGPREETTHAVPHVQLDAMPVPEVDDGLRRRAFLLPGVEERESLVSLPGARSLWLSDEIDVARPEVLQAGREFAHIHPDGSLHVWLPVDRAIEVAENRWGELHPWVGRDDFWDGLVMVYTPETLEELDVVVRLLVDAYNHVTGDAVDPGTIT